MNVLPLRRLGRLLMCVSLLCVSASCANDAPGAPGGGPNPGADPVPDPGADPDAGSGLVLAPVLDGLQRPVHLISPPGDERIFIVEKGGLVRILENGALLPAPFLDLQAVVSVSGEQGLLSLAFHPDYATNGSFFVDYTDTEGDTRVERYQVSADPDVADPGSARLVLSIAQPFGNHNGGHILFGPDGMLYIAAGDGGAAGDPQGNGQNRETRLGAILRVDVDTAEPFAIPADNPFVDSAPFLPEIWLWGLRNPWRLAFDPATGDLYVADVGQSQREEITVVSPVDGGANLGWNVVEGSTCYAAAGCTPANFTLPQVEYTHDDGCSITGGHVYRGPIEDLRGVYFYSDYCFGWLRSFRLVGGAATESVEWDVANVGNITSFGEDAAGNLYALTEQAVYRIDEAPTGS
ncbi:MAG: PQQ-dependent sugar dehydrogenase [Gemmatimonadota bacterium]